VKATRGKTSTLPADAIFNGILCVDAFFLLDDASNERERCECLGEGTLTSNFITHCENESFGKMAHCDKVE
jgi:hypothetical protein